MIKFRTELPLYPKTVKIKHNQQIFMIGSCFSSSVGQKLDQNKFKTLINPFGTLFHPLPILQNLKALIDPKPINNENFVELEERLVQFDMHSAIHAKNQKELIDLINTTRISTKEALSNTSFAFITLGSAFFYYHKKLAKAVANCHKQPSELFKRQLSGVDELKEIITETIHILKKINPKIEIILTLSPVRHKRDGLIENNRSKAHLLSAIHAICDTNSDVHYFPAYELILDDLRDYRFYDEDLVHPNQQAIKYVWSYFSQCYFDQETIEINNSVRKVSSFLNHRPFDIKNKGYQKKLSKLALQIDDLELKHSLSFEEERKQIKKHLSANSLS